MSDYRVSARKYRPSSFKTMIGQKNLTTTLKSAIDSGRLAQAYLFCGPRGVGKTSCARIFARTINCLHPTEEGEACGECESCKAITLGNSYNIIELDAASNNSVDDIRNITEEVNIPPQAGKYKVFIIDEVHMLSSQAFNAFLKTLEEPPKYVIFILATTEKHKVIPTILSRCQIYDFKRITIPDIVDHLAYISREEGINSSAEALNVIARKADGAMRDALSIFDQVAASSRGNITYETALANLNVLDYDYYFRLVDAFRAGDVGQALLEFNEIMERGFDTLFFISGLASHIRDLMVAADTRTAKLLEVAEEVIGKYTAQAQSLPLQWYYAALKLINDADFNYRTATNKQLLAELLLIRLCQLLSPASPPFDRVENEPPLSMPSSQAQVITEKEEQNKKKVEVAAQSDKNNNPENTAVKKIIQQTPKDLRGATQDKKTKGKTMRLSDLEAEYEKDQNINRERRKPISEEALTEAWQIFINENQDKPLLVGAMKDVKPTKADSETYTVKVYHPAQQQAFIANMNKLLGCLRDRLENDFLSLKVEIDETIKIKKPMPAKDLFIDIIKGNKSIADLADRLDVEII